MARLRPPGGSSYVVLEFTLNNWNRWNVWNDWNLKDFAAEPTF